jgi:aminomethyltransferase
MALHTPLHDRHLALGARMVDFAGYDMPLQYTSIRDEHVAVRTRAGIFDVSHMGEVLFGGPNAGAAVQHLVANDVSRLTPASALYGVMCNPDGGIVDDVIVNRGLAGDHFIVVVNAACREKDVAWMRANLLDGATLTDISDRTALLAVQGPEALAIVQSLTDTELGSLAPFHMRGARLADIESHTSVVSRTGYTGEDGVEIYIDAAAAPALWDAIVAAGAPRGLVPAGLGARDTLRLEAGLRLYGQDMDEHVDPFSAGLAWTVKLDAGDFVGAPALRKIKERGASHATIGLVPEGRALARHGQIVLLDGRICGEVTSGGYGFTLGHGVATALVERAHAAAGGYSVDVRGTMVAARRVPLPFYKRAVQRSPEVTRA